MILPEPLDLASDVAGLLPASNAVAPSEGQNLESMRCLVLREPRPSEVK